jgi:hypothetical protein
MLIKQIPLLEFLLIAAIVSVLTIATAWVYPTWDDINVLMMLNQLGDAGIRVFFDSRVLVSHFCIFLSHHGLFLPVGLALHWLSWFGMGLVTFRFWQITFPAHAHLALLPAILSVTPVLCKVHFVIMSVVFIDVLEPVLAFGGILLLLSESGHGRRKVLVTAGGLLLVMIAGLLSEYGVATAAVGCVLLFGKALQTSGTRKRELNILGSVLGVCALASYVVFSIIASSAASPPYRASFVLPALSADIHRIPFRLVSGLWRAVIGAYLESLGSITVSGKGPLLSFVSGAILSAAVTFAIYRKKRTGSISSRNWPAAIIMTVAIIVGALPFLLMGRTLETYWDSRFWLPALPIASSLTVYLLLSLVRERRWILVAICCGFLGGYWTSTEIIRTRKHRNVFTANFLR